MVVVVAGRATHQRGVGRKGSRFRVWRGPFLIVGGLSAWPLSYSGGIAGRGDGGKTRAGDLGRAGLGSWALNWSGLSSGSW